MYGISPISTYLVPMRPDNEINLQQSSFFLRVWGDLVSRWTPDLILYNLRAPKSKEELYVVQETSIYEIVKGSVRPLL